jgi:hypothetical protein
MAKQEAVPLDVAGKMASLVREAPTLRSPHEPHKMVQLVRSMIADPEGTDSGPFVATFLCISVQGTGSALRWVRHHAAALPKLNHMEQKEYFVQLLLDRERVKKEAR